MKQSIEASTTLRAAFARVRKVLSDDPGAVLCETCSADDRRTRRFRTTLAAALKDGMTVGHEIELELGAPRLVEGGGISLPITWHATGHDRLLPTFAGELEATADRSGTNLRLHGTYTVPLGAVGRFGDGVAGRRLVHRSLGSFVSDVSRRLDAQVNRQMEPPVADATHQVAVKDHLGSENYLG